MIQASTEKIASHTPKKPHVLLIYRKMIPSIRLCGHCQMQYLDEQGAIEYRAIQEMKLKSVDLNWADIVLLGRLDSWYECQLSKKLHESGRYLVYVMDDDLLNVPPEISSASYYNQADVKKNISTMITLSDAFLSPSPILLKKYAISGKKAIQIEEPALNPVSYQPHNIEGPIKIGFAGSIDRTGDLENILEDALKTIKQQYGDKVQFEFFGAVPAFYKELDAKCIPYCNSYDEYRSILNKLEWDIGLAPMPDSSFHACKHYNKFVEYAAAGVIGIYSDVEPYARAKNIGCPGLYCRNCSAAWEEALKLLIENRIIRLTYRKKVCDFIAHRMSVAQSASIFGWFFDLEVNKVKVLNCNFVFEKIWNMVLLFKRKVMRKIKGC